MDGANTQLKREPRSLPKLELPGFTSFKEWDHTQIKLIDYDPHPFIKIPLAV